VGKKGSAGKVQSIKFPKWMAESVEELAEKGGHTFTDVVVELLRRELEIRGYQMDLGKEVTARQEQDIINDAITRDDNKKASGK